MASMPASLGHALRVEGQRHKKTLCTRNGRQTGGEGGSEECTGNFFLCPACLPQLSAAEAGTSLKRLRGPLEMTRDWN